MQYISEGKAKLSSEGAFYNPKMKELRDISVLFLKAVGAKGPLLDSTAATGVRGIRYFKEAGIRGITFLDINKQAFSRLRSNLRLNRLKATALNKSIQEFANTTDEKFEAIDLDPFGSPQPHIFDLMKISKDGTLLMVTATDTAVLCGAHAHACYKLYNSKPLHSEHCKEVGVRILLGYISRIASQFNFGIEPLLTVSAQHYMRVFVRLSHGAEAAVSSVVANGVGSFCWKCRSFSSLKGLAPEMSRICKACGAESELFGPLWLGPLYDRKIASKIRSSITPELDTFMFYSIPKLTRSMGIGSVSHYEVIKRLNGLGFTATPTQFDNDGIKTSAPHGDVLSAVKRLSKKR